jgi:hypothetical protein
MPVVYLKLPKFKTTWQQKYSAAIVKITARMSPPAAAFLAPGAGATRKSTGSILLS